MSVRVLQVNKFFHPRAGAETSFLQTRELLVQRGVDVIDFAMEHPENIPSPHERHFAPYRSYDGSGGLPGRVRDAATSIYSLAARRRLKALVEETRPDVAHLHNVYHQLSLSVVDELFAQGVPMVLTMHDWKVACPAYTLFTDGAPCRRCPTSGYRNAIRHRCVKGSAAASALAAVEALVADRRGTYRRIQRFLAPSRFGITVAGLAGVPPDRVDYVPNFLPDADLERPDDDRSREARLVYAGRLEATKGIHQLLAAFARVPEDVSLRIAGSGELEDVVRRAAAADARITYLGRLRRDDVLEEYASARAVVMPSIWEDNGPFVLLEAQAMGTPLIVTDRGGPKEFVEDGHDGLVVDPTDVERLAGAMTRLGSDEALARRWGDRARARVRVEHTADQHFGALMGAYEAAGAVRA